jgi:hypothetical protein
MAHCGDFVQPRQWFLGEFREFSMATAIVRTYTDDGFVVASDGLVRLSDNGKILDEAGQKIFSFGTAKSLAFSFTGSIQLGSEHEVGGAFDFIEAFSTAVQARSTTRGRTLADYAQRISRAVHDSLKKAQLAKNILFTSEPSEARAEGGFTIATALIDGYFSDSASRVEIHFLHDDQQLAYPEVFPIQITTQPSVHGSPEVARLFQTDPRFAKYRTQRIEPWHSSPTLHEGPTQPAG